MYICTCVHEKDNPVQSLLHKLCQHELWKGNLSWVWRSWVTLTEYACIVYFKTNTGNSSRVPFSWSANKFPELFGIAWTALVVLLQKQVQSFQDTLTSNQPPQKNHTTFQSSRTIEDAWLKTETVDRDVYLQVWKHDISVCSGPFIYAPWKGKPMPERDCFLLDMSN